MVDLTQNTPRPLPETTSLQNKPSDTTTVLSRSLHSPEHPRKLPRPMLPSPKAHVAVASPLRNKQDRVFYGSLEGFGSGTHPLSKNRKRHPDIDACTYILLGSLSPADDENTYKRPASHRSTYGNHFVKDTKPKEEPMTRIVDVSIIKLPK